jgi:hypothetical protein
MGVIGDNSATRRFWIARALKPSPALSAGFCSSLRPSRALSLASPREQRWPPHSVSGITCTRRSSQAHRSL